MTFTPPMRPRVRRVLMRGLSSRNFIHASDWQGQGRKPSLAGCLTHGPGRYGRAIYRVKLRPLAGVDLFYEMRLTSSLHYV